MDNTTYSKNFQIQLVFRQTQCPRIIWDKTFGGSAEDCGYSVQQTTGGGYIIAGKTERYDDGDVFLIKTDANGNTVWFKIFGGSASDYGYSVQQTSDGGYIIVGSTGSYGAGEDVYLIKTDASGNTMKTFSPIPKRNYPNPSPISSPKLPHDLNSNGRIGGR